MSHDKPTNYETVLETFLKKYSPIRAGHLLSKLHESRIDISRSQFYRYAKKLEPDSLQRRNGIWYYAPSFPAALNISQEQVERKIEELKKNVLGRTPTLREVAREMLLPPKDKNFEAIYYSALRKLGLSVPSTRDILESKLPFLREENMKGEP